MSNRSNNRNRNRSYTQADTFTSLRNSAWDMYMSSLINAAASTEPDDIEELAQIADLALAHRDMRTQQGIVSGLKAKGDQDDTDK